MTSANAGGPYTSDRWGCSQRTARQHSRSGCGYGATAQQHQPETIMTWTDREARSSMRCLIARARPPIPRRMVRTWFWTPRRRTRTKNQSPMKIRISRDQLLRAVRDAEAVVPAAPVGIAMEADRDSSGEHDQVTPAMAVSPEVASVVDDGVTRRRARRHAALPSADVTAAELSADPGLDLADASQCRRPLARQDLLLGETQLEARAACPFEEAQSHEFAHLNTNLRNGSVRRAPAPRARHDRNTPKAPRAAGCGARTANWMSTSLRSRRSAGR